MYGSILNLQSGCICPPAFITTFQAPEFRVQVYVGLSCEGLGFRVQTEKGKGLELEGHDLNYGSNRVPTGYTNLLDAFLGTVF